jgi:hypothetical protein
MTLVALNLFGSDCLSAIQVDQRVQHGKIEFTAKNVSGKPMVAYVVAARDAKGNLPNVFYGVFTDGDSLRPGASMGIGSASSSRSDLKPLIDYVRLADGWTCGEASTEQAKDAVARFQK